MRSVFLLISSRFSLISSEFLVTRSRSNSIPSVFLQTCSYVAFSFSCMLGMTSRYGLNSARIASISTPTSVWLNLLAFLERFFMNNIIMKEGYFVKNKDYTEVA